MLHLPARHSLYSYCATKSFSSELHLPFTSPAIHIRVEIHNTSLALYFWFTSRTLEFNVFSQNKVLWDITIFIISDKRVMGTKYLIEIILRFRNLFNHNFSHLWEIILSSLSGTHDYATKYVDESQAKQCLNTEIDNLIKRS